METQPVKENKSSKLDKLLKISIVTGIILIAVALFYYLFLRPYIKDRNLKNCLMNAENQYNQSVRNLDNELQSLYQERSEKENEKQKLEKQESDLVTKMNEEINSPDFKQEFNIRKAIKLEQYETEEISGYKGWKLTNKIITVEKEVKEDYYKENDEYNMIKEKLQNIRSEIDNISNKINDLDKENTIRQLKNKSDEEKDYCFKLY